MARSGFCFRQCAVAVHSPKQNKNPPKPGVFDCYMVPVWCNENQSGMVGSYVSADGADAKYDQLDVMKEGVRLFIGDYL
jgi:hypothetical protein